MSEMSDASDISEASNVSIDPCDADYTFVKNVKNFMGVANPVMLKRFGHHNYAYELFVRLMDKLESIATEVDGFWFNRSMILQEAPYLTIVVNRKNDIVAFYTLIPNKERKASDISFFQVFDEGKGIARHIIETEAAQTNLYVSHSIPEAKGFWDKMGIKYDN